MTNQDLPSRRAILATGLTVVTSGCMAPFSNGPDCSLSYDHNEEEDHVYMYDLGTTSNNVNKGGNCSRWTANSCFQITLWINTAVINRIEVQAPDNEIVARWSTNSTSESERPMANESKTSASDSEDVFVGVTQTPSANNPSFGPDVPDSALGVYFELADLNKGEMATRQILLFDDDEEQVEEISATLDCS
ncbi:hypothetical protein [Haloferax elongans]|uniref:hypothetical protein n=1 Tax=Haloferax elongans TaxID=403191 RepID=UPI00135F1564|nr:hypothetical protein [Haloferax elongans]